MTNFKKTSVREQTRTELHDELGLTGAEISINVLPAGANVPFVHSHRQNEEIYAILDGEGAAIIDGERVGLNVGDWLRVSPEATRQFFASPNKFLKYICIQVKADSLEGYTMSDAIV